MNYIIAPVVALGLALSVGSFFTSDAFAKAHDQGADQDDSPQPGRPGTNVGSETVGPAQGLGESQSDGKGRGPSGTPGNSENAGRSGGDANGTAGGSSNPGR